MNRRALIATAPLLLLTACGGQRSPKPSPGTTPPEAPADTPTPTPTPTPTTAAGHGIEVLKLNEPAPGAMGATVQLTKWEVGKLDGTYGDDAKQGDPVVYVTATLTNDTIAPIEVGPVRRWEASNGPASTPVPTLRSTQWSPWPKRLLAGRSADERFAIIGTPDDMTDLVLTFTMNSLGFNITWQGDVTQMI